MPERVSDERAAEMFARADPVAGTGGRWLPEDDVLLLLADRADYYKARIAELEGFEGLWHGAVSALDALARGDRAKLGTINESLQGSVDVIVRREIDAQARIAELEAAILDREDGLGGDPYMVSLARGDDAEDPSRRPPSYAAVNARLSAVEGPARALADAVIYAVPPLDHQHEKCEEAGDPAKDANPKRNCLCGLDDCTGFARALLAALEGEGDGSPRFPEVSCSSCGRAFGPGDHGFSHCDQHEGMPSHD